MKISKEIMKKFEGFQRVTSSMINESVRKDEYTIVGIQIKDENETAYEYHRRFNQLKTECWIKVENKNWKVTTKMCKNVSEAISEAEKLFKKVKE